MVRFVHDLPVRGPRLQRRAGVSRSLRTACPRHPRRPISSERRRRRGPVRDVVPDRAAWRSAACGDHIQRAAGFVPVGNQERLHVSGGDKPLRSSRRSDASRLAGRRVDPAAGRGPEHGVRRRQRASHRAQPGVSRALQPAARHGHFRDPEDLQRVPSAGFAVPCRRQQGLAGRALDVGPVARGERRLPAPARLPLLCDHAAGGVRLGPQSLHSAAARLAALRGGGVPGDRRLSAHPADARCRRREARPRESDGGIRLRRQSRDFDPRRDGGLDHDDDLHAGAHSRLARLRVRRDVLLCPVQAGAERRVGHSSVDRAYAVGLAHPGDGPVAVGEGGQHRVFVSRRGVLQLRLDRRALDHRPRRLRLRPDDAVGIAAAGPRRSQDRDDGGVRQLLRVRRPGGPRLRHQAARLVLDSSLRGDSLPGVGPVHVSRNRQKPAEAQA